MSQCGLHHHIFVDASALSHIPEKDRISPYCQHQGGSGLDFFFESEFMFEVLCGKPRKKRHKSSLVSIDAEV